MTQIITKTAVYGTLVASSRVGVVDKYAQPFQL